MCTRRRASTHTWLGSSRACWCMLPPSTPRWPKAAPSSTAHTSSGTCGIEPLAVSISERRETELLFDREYMVCVKVCGFFVRCGWIENVRSGYQCGIESSVVGVRACGMWDFFEM